MRNTRLQASLAAAVIAASTLPLHAQSTSSTPPMQDANRLFRAREFSLDLFGSGSVGQQVLDDFTGERIKDDGRMGAGAGVNFFFTRNFGIGADAYSENTDNSFVDKVSGNLIARLPFDSAHVAPYIFGGGGRQFDPEDLWFGQVGGGVEVRVTRQWGVFVDARYMMFDEADNVGLGRAGLRFAL